MKRETKDGKKIEIDTYEDVSHMINICKKFNIHTVSYNIQDLRDAINKVLEQMFNDVCEEESIKRDYLMK